MTQKAACLTAVRTYGDKRLRDGLENGFTSIELMREVKRLTSERDRMEEEVNRLTRENNFFRRFIADKNRAIGKDTVARFGKQPRRKRSDTVEAAVLMAMFFITGAFGAFAAMTFMLNSVTWPLW